MAKGRKDAPARTTSAAIGRPWHETRWFPWALAAFYLAVVLILFWEFVSSSLMLYGSDTMQAVVYFRDFYVEAVHIGSFPEWSPYLFGGMPFVDAFHSDIFYPFTFIKFLLPLGRTRGWELVIHFWLGGLGMYAAARDWKMSRPAAAVAGLTYMVAPYFVSMVHPGHDGKIYVTAWFPLGFLFLKRIWDDARLSYMGVFALIVGVIILTPHVQMAYFALWGYAGYSLYRIVRALREEKRVSWKSSVGALGAVLVAVGISAVQFYPAYFYVKNHSPRAGEGRGFDYASSWSLHPEEIVSEVVPEFSGVAGKDTNTYWGRNYFKDNSEYGGVVALLLAVYAVFRTRFKDRWFFFGLGVFAALYGLGAHTPLFTLFYHVVPNVKQMRAPSMIMFLYLFSICLCAAAALDALMQTATEKKPAGRGAKLLWILGFVLTGLALLVTIAPAGMLSIYTGIFYSGITPDRAQVLSSHLGGIVIGLWISTILALGLAYFAGRLSGGSTTWALAGVAALVLVDAGRMDFKFITTIDLSRYFQRDAVVDFLKAQPQPVRVLPVPRGFPTNYFALNDIQELTGYHGNQLRTYNDFLGGSNQPRQFTRQALDLAAVDFIIFRRGSNLQGDPSDPTLQKAYDQGGVVAYRNLAALPRARLVTCWERHDPADTLYDRLFSADFDYRNCVIVEGDLPFPSAHDSLSPGTATITNYGLEAIDVDVDATREALLVLADNDYPAWMATVDGAPAAVHTTNATFRGVAVPPGRHQVRFEYHSQRLRTGTWVTVLSTLLAGLVIGVDVLIHKRKP
jgi:hypothetical protein